MKIYAEPALQVLLCIAYSFEGDCPLEREVARRRFEPGVRQKEWWRYQHTYLGLRTLIAYQGPRPVGQVEFMPVEHAPRPISQGPYLCLNCLHVAPPFRRQGVGSALLQAVEKEAESQGRGVAVVARSEGDFMPAAFYRRMGYQLADQRDGELLLTKSRQPLPAPRFLPMGYHPQAPLARVGVDYFHCPQCPLSGWALAQLERRLRPRGDAVRLKVHETGERPEVERWGLTGAVYVDGVPLAGWPPRPEAILAQVDQELEARRLGRERVPIGAR